LRHLAISLAIAAAESGRRVYYGTLVALIESLENARSAGQPARRLRVLSHSALLIVDEIGYLPVWPRRCDPAQSRRAAKSINTSDQEKGEQRILRVATLLMRNF
jgi:hypothetical protein